MPPTASTCRDVASRTQDSGSTWRSAGDLTHLGEDAAYLRWTTVVVGESGAVGGSSVSTDGGRTWTRFSDVGFHTLDCTRDGSCWAAGGRGRVGNRLSDAFDHFEAGFKVADLIDLTAEYRKTSLSA